jgi:hypothetical protein
MNPISNATVKAPGTVVVFAHTRTQQIHDFLIVLCLVLGRQSQRLCQAVHTFPLSIVGGRRLPRDCWCHMLSFLDAFDLLPFSQCSKGSLAAATLPTNVVQLLNRETLDQFNRGLLVVLFLSRQSNDLLCAVLKAVGQMFELFFSCGMRHRLLYYMQLAKLCDKFPSDPAIYAFTDKWQLPRTLAAAWLNDLSALQDLVMRNRLKANVKAMWPNRWPATTPLAVCTDPTCLALLLQHGADVHADVRSIGGSERFPLLHEAALRCNPEALSALLKAGASSDINVYVREQTALHRALYVGPVEAFGLSCCPPCVQLRRSVARGWPECVSMLLAAGAQAHLTAGIHFELNHQRVHHTNALPTSIVLWKWEYMCAQLDADRMVSLFRELALALRSHSHRVALIDGEIRRFDAIVQSAPGCFGSYAPTLRSILLDILPLRVKIARLLWANPRNPIGWLRS